MRVLPPHRTHLSATQLPAPAQALRLRRAAAHHTDRAAVIPWRAAQTRLDRGVTGFAATPGITDHGQ